MPGQLRQLIHWQVGRDRNNWAGRKPVRQPYVGDELHFDWRGAWEDIQKAIANATDLTNDGDQVEKVKIPKVDKAKKVVVPTKVEKAKVTTPKSIRNDVRTCELCRMSVWTGKGTDKPHGLCLAHPLETDWSTSPNGQPYCEKCWKKEETFMKGVAEEHRAVGPKRRQLVVLAQSKVIAEAIASTTSLEPPRQVQMPPEKDKKKKPKKKNRKKKVIKTKKKKKKQLGGVRRLPEPAEVKRWQVRFCLPHPT